MRLRRLTAFLLLCTFSFQQVTFASGGLVTGVLEMAQHFSPEGAPAGFEIYLDEGLREEIVLNRNDGALQSVVETVIENQEPEALPQNHISWLKAIDLKRHEIADNADQAIDKVFDYIKPEADSLTEEILFLPQTASAEVLRLIAKGFVDVLRTGDLLDEIWDDAQGAWKDVHDGNLSDAGKKLLSLSGNTFIEVSRVLDLAMIGGIVDNLAKAGAKGLARVLKEGATELIERLLRSTKTEDFKLAEPLLKNKALRTKFLEEAKDARAVAKAFEKKLLTPEDLKGFKKIVRGADEANAEFLTRKPGRKPPWSGPVEEQIATETEQYVRVFVAESEEGVAKRTTGEWLVPKSQIEGKSAAEIKDLLALPGDSFPTHVVDVEIPAGQALRKGKAAAIEGFGKGGAQQVEIVGFEEIPNEIRSSWFKNARKLEKL